MSSSSSVIGSVILGNQSGSTTRWQVEQDRVPSHAPVVCACVHARASDVI